MNTPQAAARLEVGQVAPDRVERDAESHGELRGAHLALDAEQPHDLAAPLFGEEFDDRIGHACRITQKHAEPRKG
jgi:hypothetical protein